MNYSTLNNSTLSDSTSTGTRAPADGSRLPGRFARLPELAGAGFLPLGLAARLPLAMLTESWAVIVTALVAGASCPQVGPMARVRWMALTTRNLAGGGSKGPDGARRSVAANRADLDAALSYEGTADEITFVLGPALVGVLASVVAPWLPLSLAAILTITLVPLFAVHPTHLAVAPEPRKQHQGVQPGQGSWLPVALPVCMGTFFGSTQTALTAFAGVFRRRKSAACTPSWA